MCVNIFRQRKVKVHKQSYSQCIMLIYIIISLFSPCHCSICGPYVTVRTKISRANVHFAALTLFISKEREWSYHYSVSVNTEDLIVLPNFKLRLFENEADKKKKLNHNLTKEKDYSSNKLSLYEILRCDYKRFFFCSAFAFQRHL